LNNFDKHLSKPERNFCAGGPIPKEGYYVLRDRPEISEIVDKVEKGRYFVIYAPRQVGKTSLIQEVVQKLADDSEYLPLYLTFQDFGKNINEEEFYQQLARILLREIDIALREKGDSKNHRPEVEIGKCRSEWSFSELLETLHEQIPYHLCLFIDEFEDIPQDVLDGFLRTLRGIYLRKQRDESYNILHSVGVIGVRSISQMTFARTSSPFNIHESISISNFTTEQVRELLMQYSSETGEVFSEEVIEFIADKTGGQPYLVNVVAKILTTEIKPYTETRYITISDAENAYMKMLTMRGNSNLDSIRKRIREANNRKRLMSIITRGNVRYNPNDEILEELITFGIIQDKDGYCVISNPAYAHTIIYSYMPWNNGTPEEFFPEGYQPVVDVDGFIKPHPVIENFQYFLPKVDPIPPFPPLKKEGRGDFPQETPLEIVPHYFLLGQFDVLAYHVGGHARAEVHQGHKRMDIVVFEKGGRKTVIECKIWHGVAYQQEAREQLVDYLIHERLLLGYLVFFAQSQKSSYSFSTVEVFGKTVCEYIIPLPEKLSNIGI
jgi:AAA+ ATPase superfamily predicted ATPase